MGRFKPYARRELSRRRRHWLRRNSRVVSLMTAGILAIGALCTWLLTVQRPVSSDIWYLMGAFHASLAAALLHVFNSVFLASDGRAIHQVRGAWGEEATRDELRRARRRRLIWGWVDSIPAGGGDIDHVVVTRRGGVLAIDSKWSTHLTPEDRADMARAAKKARLRAQAVAEGVLRKQRGSHRARVGAFEVRPVVVIWGPEQHNVPDDARAVVDGVRFVAGSRLRTWLGTLADDDVGREQARELRTHLERTRERWWDKATA